MKIRGFTLVEMVVVLTIVAIISVIVAIFIRNPVAGYAASVSRADLVDRADTALRRMTREVRLALPNSMRITTAGNSQFVEFLLTRIGGRYRIAGPGDFLAFDGTDTSFETIGSLPNGQQSNSQQIVPNADALVIYNLGSAGFDAYAGDNRRLITGVTYATDRVSMNFQAPGFTENQRSPENRFYVVMTPVTFACNLSTGQLMRYSNYPISAQQPTVFPATSGNMLTDRVTACAFTFNPTVHSYALFTAYVSMGDATEAINLYEETHVANAP